MDKKIYVIAEHDDKKVSPFTYEVLSFADQISKLNSLSVEVVMAGCGLSSMAESFAETGFNVNILEVPGLEYYNSEVYKDILHSWFCLHKPAFICIPHTARGMDFSPGLGVRMKAANISAVLGFEENKGRLLFLRAVDNGKKVAKVLPVTDTAILNVAPGMFKPLKRKTGLQDSTPGSVLVHRMEKMPENMRFKGIKKAKTDAKAISEAQVIVSVGNGIKDGEHLDLIYKMADLFHRSAVGGSRIVCDKGLLEYSQQVGITGAVVSPRLYIACGISGSSQHLAGMSGSEFIAAINTDPKAPIMNSSDVCIVDDLTRFIPVFIDVFHEQRGNKPPGCS